MSVAAENLGKLVFAIMDHCDFVRINHEEGILDKGIIVIKMMANKNGTTYVLSEAVSLLSLEQVSDIAVLADAIVEKWKRQIVEGRTKR